MTDRTSDHKYDAITITRDQAIDLLGYLDHAGHGMSEYGHNPGEPEALEAFKAMINAKLDAVEDEPHD